MASYISALASGIQQLRLGNETIAPIDTPQNPHEVIQKHISSYNNDLGCLSECVAKCAACFEENLMEFDCDLSEASQTTIELYLSDCAPLYLDAEARLELKNEFNKALCKVVQEKWASGIAKAFYPISKISKKPAQAVNAEKWVRQFFAGVGYFAKWENNSVHNGHYIAEFQAMVSQILTSYCHEIKQQKMQTITRLAQENPTCFQQLLENAFLKNEKDPLSLSENEKTALEVVTSAAHCLTGYFPDVESDATLLKKCIWHGYSIQGMQFLETPEDKAKFFIDTFGGVTS